MDEKDDEFKHLYYGDTERIRKNIKIREKNK